jgi:hypothetical protein
MKKESEKCCNIATTVAELPLKIYFATRGFNGDVSVDVISGSGKNGEQYGNWKKL